MNSDFELSQAVGSRLLQRNETLALAESCTGGWIAKVITDVPGSSNWFGYGFVTYSNEAKHKLLGVPMSIFEKWGAVSAECVKAMASGAQRVSGASWALSVSGIAGPSGGTPDKPVGTVWFGLVATEGIELALRQHFPGNREDVRHAATLFALQLLLEKLNSPDLGAPNR